MTLMRNNNKRGGRRSSTTFHNNAATTSRAYQPHRPGYHWEPAKQPLDDDDDDFLQRIVHGSCQGVPSCQGDNLTCHSMAEQLDLFTHCRHPASFLSFFNDHPHDRDGSVEILHAGAYRMPEGCEYCGAPDTHHCRSTNCRRPEFYFQKKRPPFAKPDPTLWDPVTEHAVEKPVRPVSPFEGTWVAGLFLGGRAENKAHSNGR